MSLIVDHRPKRLNDVIGNDAIVESIQALLKRKKSIPSAFMFTGSAGTGKTTLARIIAHELKCKDIIELNAADDRGIDAIRRLRDGMKFSPLSGKKKVFILDESHSLTGPSQEALLKILEEPPEYVHLCIATTNPEKLRPTFKRRCHIYEMKPFIMGTMNKFLKMILKKEKVQDFPKEIITKIIELSDGSPGIALKYLDQVIDMDDVGTALSILKSAGTDEADVKALCQILLGTGNNQSKWNKIAKMLKNYNGDGESMRRPILGYLTAVLMNNGSPEVAAMSDYFVNNFYDSGKSGLRLACWYAIHGD